MVRASVLMLFAVAGAGCRQPYTPVSTGDMSFALPRLVWAKTVDTPGSVPRADLPLVLVPEQHALVGFGGDPLTQNDAWSFSLKDDAWQKLLLGTVSPPGRDGHCAAYLPIQTELLLAGGHGDSGSPAPASSLLTVDTPGFAPVTTDRTTAGDGCAAAYLTRSQGVVVYGGSSTPDETWLFDGSKSAYTKLDPSNTPGGRQGAALVDDPGELSDAGVQDFLILYGGVSGGVEADDLWIYNGDAWGMVGTSSDPNATDSDDPRPQGRTQAAVALDSQRHLLYVFGGLRQGIHLADLWCLDLRNTTWHRLDLDGAPVGRSGASVAYDPVLDRVLLFGGVGDSGLLSDGWTLSVTP